MIILKRSKSKFKAWNKFIINNFRYRIIICITWYAHIHWLNFSLHKNIHFKKAILIRNWHSGKINHYNALSDREHCKKCLQQWQDPKPWVQVNILQNLQYNIMLERDKFLTLREEQLKKFQKFLQESEAEMIAALHTDLHKHKLEGLFEIAGLQKDVQNTINKFRDWAKPELVWKSILFIKYIRVLNDSFSYLAWKNDRKCTGYGYHS